MHFGCAKIKSQIFLFAKGQAEAKEPCSGFEGYASAQTLVPQHGIATARIIERTIVDPGVIVEGVEVGIGAEQEAILERSQAEIGGKYAFFIKTPEEAISADAYLLIG